MAKEKKQPLLNPNNLELQDCYAVGYAYGTSRRDATRKYVRILVSTGKAPSTRSYYSLFEEDKLLEKCGIVKDDLDFPPQGKPEVRVALTEAIDLEKQMVFWSVEHCPVLMPGNDNALYQLYGVSDSESAAEADACAALRRRYTDCEKIAPIPELLIEQKRFLTPDFVSKSDVFAAVNGDRTWEEALKDLLE